jgi:peptide/nickel transport system substrate-binding protein
MTIFLLIGMAHLYAGGTQETAVNTVVNAGEAKELFVYGIDGDPTNNVNPITASGRYDLMATKAMFSPLWVFNGPEDLDFYLAIDVSASADMLTYTVKLRNDVKWHDGEEFNADDVVFTYKTIVEQPTANGHDVYQFNGNPMKIVKVDDYTVQFIFPTPIPFALEILSAEKFMTPEHIWAGETEFQVNEKNAHPIGTGPYKFSEYREGESLTLVKNEDYFMGEPAIDTVIYRVVLDANAAVVALQKGEIDALAIQPTDVSKFDENQISVYPYSENRIGYLSAVLYRENMDNINFRKAILFGINKSDLIKATYVSEDFALNAISFLPEHASYYSKEVESYAYNVSMAKEYLAKSGLKNPQIKIAYLANNPTYETQALLIQANLATVGIACELMPLDAGAMYNNALYPKTAEFDLFLGGYIMGVDPDNYASLFTSDGGANFSGIKNETIDGLFAAGRVELDTSKRAAIYKELQKEFMDYAFFLPLTENKRILAISNRIGGIDEAKLVPIFTFEDMSKLTEK